MNRWREVRRLGRPLRIGHRDAHVGVIAVGADVPVRRVPAGMREQRHPPVVASVERQPGPGRVGPDVHLAAPIPVAPHQRPQRHVGIEGQNPVATEVVGNEHDDRPF